MDCPSIPFQNYGAFSESLYSRVSNKRIPLSGSLEVTARCNLLCEHCYLPFSLRKGSRENELSFSEIQRLLSEIADAGCLWLLLTGGEPFLRQDFLDIYDEAKQKGFIITLFTNGTLITAQHADHLSEWRPFAIEISLYGATQATYERLTGIPGSYARCMQGIELLLARNLPLKLKSVLLTLNQHELKQMEQLAKNLGVGFHFDPGINAGIDGSLHPTQFRLTPEEIISVEVQDPNRAREWPLAIGKVKDRELSTRQMYMCGAGWTAFHIDSTGKLCLCLSSRTPNYDLRKGSFQEGWDNFLFGLRQLQYSTEFECLGCDLRAICAQCPALASSELGDLEARVPFLCELTHLRHLAFDPTTAVQ